MTLRRRRMLTRLANWVNATWPWAALIACLALMGITLIYG